MLVGAGSIASCDSNGAERTATLLDDIDGTVFTLGDNAYESGTADGYYSYSLGEWQILVLNSNCIEIGGCDSRSPQGAWLRDELQLSGARCTLAYWHHRRFSSGGWVGGHEALVDAWQLLYDAGPKSWFPRTRISYERFVPQTPRGAPDPERRVRQFIVGTGGRDFHPIGSPLANGEVLVPDTFGVLKLGLVADGYSWEFITAPDAEVMDRGDERCHGSFDIGVLVPAAASVGFLIALIVVGFLSYTLRCPKYRVI